MKTLLLFALLSSVSAFGQAYSDSVTQNSPGNYGRPVPYASVQVCNIADTGTPCTQKVSTFTNDSLGVACTQSAGSGVLTGAPVSGANCNNPGIADANGNFTIYVVPGQYRICTYANNWLCQNVSIGGSGGGIPFACASAVNGSIVAMTSTITSSCDPNGITDFIGHWTSQSYRATGTFNGTVELTGGLADPTNPPDTNSFAFLAPLTVPTPYYLRPPSSVGTVGQCLDIGSQVISTNGTIDTASWINCGLTTVSLTATSPIVVTPSPITGTGVISCPTCSTSTGVHGLSFTIYNSAGLASGSTTASTDYLTIPFGCTIGAYNLAVDTGTITVKFWKIASGTAIPTVSNSINTSGVGISSGTAIHSTTLSDFTTTTVTANDIMAMNITAVSGATLVNGVLQCQ